MDDDNRQIFESWLTEHRGIIVKTVRGFTTKPSDADDLSQEIVLALWRSIDSFRGNAKPSTWIWRIALNRAISWQRAAKAPHIDLDDVPEPSAKERADDALLVDRIYAAIRTLAPLDRSLMMLSLAERWAGQSARSRPMEAARCPVRSPRRTKTSRTGRQG